MAWPAWRLWLEGKATITELHEMSIDGIDIAYHALEEWQAAGHRIEKRVNRQ